MNLLCGHSVPYSETWPTSGSMRSGSVFERPTQGHRTAGSGSSSSPGLLPTPVADHSRGLPSETTEYASLPNVAASLLPTPRGQNGEERNQNVWERPLDEPQNLENALARIGVPTPPPSPDGSTS